MIFQYMVAIKGKLEESEFLRLEEEDYLNRFRRGNGRTRPLEEDRLVV